MNPTPADIVAAARMVVQQRHPYLSPTLFALRPHPAPGLGTLAVDEGWRLYYDPETVTRWYEEQQQGRLNKVAGTQDWHHGVAAVVFHELGHVLRQHAQRQGDRDPACANAAMDREINDDVVQAGWRLPGRPLMPADIGMENGLTFEEYYKASATWSGCCVSDGAPGCGGKCGGIAGNPTDWEKQNSGAQLSSSGSGAAVAPLGEGSGSNPPGSSPFPQPASALEQQIILRKTAMETLAHAKSRGTIPRGLKVWAEAMILPPKVNWRKRLAGLCRQALSSCAGAVDFTWRRIGKRSSYSAGRTGYPLAPALYQPAPKVAVVLDTSGSMGYPGSEGRTLLDEALAEVLGIVRACGGDCWGVACDADAHGAVRLHSQCDLEKLNLGGGGTDMRPGWQRAKQLRPDVVVIVTDGLVGDGWPDQDSCRHVRTLAALVGESGACPEYIPSVRVD